MKRSFAAVAVLVALVVVGFANRSVPSGFAQTDESSPTGTVAAQQTIIADLQTRVAVLETQAAAGGSPPETPTVGPIGTTPIAIENGVVALYVYAEESTYGANIYGELLNTIDRPAAVPEIEATLFDEGGDELETIRL
ncbi:MAG: hypothetical protein QOF73_2137 [Thermomicrobiales bacterium]|nr:hypothetical protein [Thermomicrobiales bacterium]